MDANDIKFTIADLNDQALFADNYDEALIGYVEIGGDIKALYNYEAMIHITMENDNVDRDEAVEYLEFNVLSAYMGDGTPAYATLLKGDDI